MLYKGHKIKLQKNHKNLNLIKNYTTMIKKGLFRTF